MRRKIRPAGLPALKVPQFQRRCCMGNAIPDGGRQTGIPQCVLFGGKLSGNFAVRSRL